LQNDHLVELLMDHKLKKNIIAKRGLMVVQIQKDNCLFC
jgi:hypothetical protein